MSNRYQAGYISPYVNPALGNPVTVLIKVWGSGGGAGGYSPAEYGGPGGYATATFLVASGTTLTLCVGFGGDQGNDQTYGQPLGGSGNPNSLYGGQGGGLVGVFVGNYTMTQIGAGNVPKSAALIIAGSGGGANYYDGGYGGGYGGGDYGGISRDRTAGLNNPDVTQNLGQGGTPVGGGNGGFNLVRGGDGQLYQGGNAGGVNGIFAGGGGAGWYGGGAGSGDGSNPGGGGGGGSGMIAGYTNFTTLPSGVISFTNASFTTQTGSGVTAPNNADADYAAGIGVGGSGTGGTGGNGRIVMTVAGVKTAYTASSSAYNVTV